MASVRNLISLYENLADSRSKEVTKVVDECPAEFQTTKGTQRRSSDGQCSGQKVLDQCSGGSGVQKSPPVWVSCDDCRKWRRIPSYLADVVKQPNFQWTCKDNEDKAFADCTVPPEMSDKEIDAELKSYACNDAKDFACIIENSEPISWTEIRSNVFLHRDRKTQKTDEGEEVTFNYHYVPVSGAVAKRCFGGAINCQGYTGGNSSDAGAIVRDVSDEYPKTVMQLPELEKDTSCISMSYVYPFGALKQTTGHVQSENTMSSIVSVFHNSSHSSNITEAEETMCGQRSDAQPLDLMKSSSTMKKANAISAEETMCGQRSDAQPLDLMKSSSTMKKANAISPSSTIEREKQMSISTRHIERIEEKLKKLLDERGGIGNHKHATEYLKLMSVITKEGDNLRGVHRARGLSSMFDALLKTKPLSVLVYISKNGLQMLHDVMKHNINDFMRTPIIRKLLKVLEFLAAQGILTQERIRNYPFTGTESFENSMMALTRHPNMQVRYIARRLKDEWKLHTYEKPGRKVGPSQQNATSVPVTSTYSTSGTLIQEPESQWVQPSDVPVTSTYSMSGTIIQEPESQWVQPSDVPTKDPPWSAKGTESDLKFLKPTSADADDEAPSEFQSLCKNTHMQNRRTGLDGASVTRKRPSPGSDLYNCTSTQPARQPLHGPAERSFQPQRHVHDIFGGCWPSWPQEENRPLKEWRRKNSQEEKWLLKDESPQEDNSGHEAGNWRKRLQQEESKWLKRPCEKEMPLQDENCRRRPQDMEMLREDNWGQKEWNRRKRSRQEERLMEEHKWLKRPRGEERSREEKKWLKRPRREESSREEQKLQKSLQLEEMPLQEEKENWRRRPQDTERYSEDDWRKKRSEKERPRANWWKRSREEKCQWEEREQWRRNRHG